MLNLNIAAVHNVIKFQLPINDSPQPLQQKNAAMLLHRGSEAVKKRSDVIALWQ